MKKIDLHHSFRVPQKKESKYLDLVYAAVNDPFFPRFFFALQSRRKKERLLLMWLEGLDALLQSGCSLLSALSALRSDDNLKLYSGVTHAIVNGLESGTQLSVLLEQHILYFGQLYRYISSAEYSGNLKEVLHKLTEMYRRFYELRFPFHNPYVNAKAQEFFLKGIVEESEIIKEINEYIVQSTRVLKQGKKPEVIFEESSVGKGLVTLRTENGDIILKEVSHEKFHRYLIVMCVKCDFLYWSREEKKTEVGYVVEGDEYIFEFRFIPSFSGGCVKLKPRRKERNPGSALEL